MFSVLWTHPKSNDSTIIRQRLQFLSLVQCRFFKWLIFPRSKWIKIYRGEQSFLSQIILQSISVDVKS